MSRRNLVKSADSPSLWNCTLSPGWKREESQILRLALMKFGVGRWNKIIESRCLPGKTPAQLCLQTQRLLGQQSIGEFMGLHLDTNEVYTVNQAKTGQTWKNGVIINTGKNPTIDERNKKIAENKEKYGLSKEDIDSIELPDRSAEYNKEHDVVHAQSRLHMLRDRLKYLKQVYRERTGESDVEDDEVSTSSKPSVSSKPSISSKADSTKPAAAKKKAAAAPKKKAAPKSSATNSKKRKKPDAGEDVPLDPETGEPIDYDPADFASDQEPASDDDFEPKKKKRKTAKK